MERRIELIKTAIEMHDKLADQYRKLAQEACEEHQTWDVYHWMKAAMAEESKARALKRSMGV